MPDNDHHPMNWSFDHECKRAELELKFITELSEARLRDAKTNSIQAHVLEQMLTNRCKATSIAEYESSLMRFHNKRAEYDRQIADMRRHSAALELYKLGHRLATVASENCWSAYMVFVRQVTGDALERFFSTPVSDGVLDEHNWIARRPGIPQELPTKEAVATSALLLDWQYEVRATTIVRFGSAAHRASMAGLGILASGAAAGVAALEAALEKLRTGEYDIWKPQDLIKLTDSPVT